MTQYPIWVFEADAGVPGSPTIRTLRASSGPVGYRSLDKPGDYPCTIIDAANVRRNLIAPRRTFGPSEMAAGEVRLDNTDGRYDEWFDFGYGFPGRLWLAYPDTPYANLIPVIFGKIEQPTGGDNDIVFRFRDRQLELERLISPEYYLGTNSGTTGTEGTADDIKGKNKIRIFGAPYNVSPDPANANDRLFSYNHAKDGSLAAVASITQRLNGSPWTPGTNYASLALLQAGTPAQGVYDTARSLGLERLGGSAPGEGGGITADIVESSTAALNRMPSVVERILIDAGVDPSEIVNELSSGSPTPADWQVGLVVRGETYREALDMLCGESAIVFWPDSQGVYKIRKFMPPQVPVCGFKRFDFPNTAEATDFAIIALNRIATKDEGAGVPAWRITVNYQKMWTVQDKDAMAAAVSFQNKEFYGREYRSVTVENPAIRDQFPEAVEMEFNTLLNDEADARRLADHFMLLYGTPRRMFNLSARYTVPVAESIDLGDTVTVTYPRFGLENGADFVITGIRYDAKNFNIELELWG